MPDLARLGWDSVRAAEWAAEDRGGDVPGRVALEHNHVYRVLTAEGELLAEATGRLKYLASGRNELPAVGDWVSVRAGSAGQGSQIRAILTRRSAFSRKAAGRGTTEQVIAANIDVVFIVFGLDGPLKLRAIERYLVVARRSGAMPVVVLNKSDVHEDVAGAVAEAVTAGDVPVHATSATQQDGLGALEPYLTDGRTVALLGPSGAGKSSLVNRLVGRELLPTGEVRAWDARGRHTSVHRQLVVRAEGGLVIDTPGIRELQPWDADDPMDEVFADIEELSTACRFRDCRHDAEPGCAVKKAVEDGALDAARYDHFVRLAREQAALDLRRDERAQLEAKRESKSAQKALRSLYKQRGR